VPNKLIHSTSPYLLQHAHNPVDWHPWNEDTLHKARALDKILLISIGYSACHWCHVMERESFEDQEVAALMNAHFICIKVDREERPDVDMVYMNAVQLITGGGGWPLNCFALPDGRPFFGGTYFRKGQWMQLMENIALLYKTRRNDLETQAEAVSKGVTEEELFPSSPGHSPIRPESIQAAAQQMKNNFDLIHGGFGGAPKFPMPANLMFLLRATRHFPDPETDAFLQLTLKKMAFGGIYDQVGGGFTRYSTDARWHVPHFEKMLYDNAQMASLYAQAWMVWGDALYLETAEETLQFVLREMTSPEGGFYTALDADSEGAEGRFYTWLADEFRGALPRHADLLVRYFHIGGQALWEHGQNIPVRTRTSEEFAREQGLRPSAFRLILKSAKARLLRTRSRRVRPGLDNKMITSWNALMIQGFCDAYRATGTAQYLDAALRCGRLIMEIASRTDGGLNHLMSGHNPVNGFLDDYAFTANAFIDLYQLTFDELWLKKALSLVEYTLLHFSAEDSPLLSYTSDLDHRLFSRKTEISDSVTPSSNAMMARSLFLLGLAFERDDLTGRTAAMTGAMARQASKYPAGFGKWLSVMMDQAQSFYTIALTGPDALKMARSFHRLTHPPVFLCGSIQESDIPILKDRLQEGQTMIFVCTGRECKLPTTSVDVAMKLLIPG
jgi:hypothetical protein